MLKRLILLWIFLGIVLFFCSDSNPDNIKSDNNCVSFDLDSIQKRGRLIAVTDFNSTNYFIYKGEPMGFHYELLQAFSYYLGLDIEIVTENSLERAFGMLKSGDADVLAIGLTVNSSRKKDFLFTEPIEETKQVLVQRKPQNWRSLTSDDIDHGLIRNQIGLAGKTIYVQEGSSHAEQLVALSKEIGDSINIVEVPYDAEKLIRHVANGDIDYTVCDENVAMVNSTYYPIIDVSTAVSIPQSLAWAVRKNKSDSLLIKLNKWITTYKKTESYALLHSKYFNNSRSSIIVKSDYYAQSTGKVSKYDDIIKKYSNIIKWDWRLLASLICQESRFNPNVRSLSGAYGLMQIMPVTGKKFGIDITSSPENNLKAGIMYIKWLHSIFNPIISDEKERLNFILAAYNAGPGHVLDAMHLAEKNGKNPQKWKGNVAIWLTKKYDPQYYNDIVVKCGYFKGNESVNFVSEILTRFEHYKNIIPKEKNRSLTASK